MIISEQFTPKIEIKVGVPSPNHVQIVLSTFPESPYIELHINQWIDLNNKVLKMFSVIDKINKPFVPASLSRG